MTEAFQDRLNSVRENYKRPMYIFAIGSVKVLTNNEELINVYRRESNKFMAKNMEVSPDSELSVPQMNGMLIEYADVMNSDNTILSDENSSFNAVIFDKTSSSQKDFEFATKLIADQFVDVNGESSTKYVDEEFTDEDYNIGFRVTVYNDGEMIDKLSNKDCKTPGGNIPRDVLHDKINSMIDYSLLEADRGM